MNNRLLRIAATLASLAVIRTLPQAIAVSVAESAMTASVAASVPGKWFHDTQDATSCDARGLTDGRRTTAIVVGSYVEPGSYEARVPVQTPLMVDGKVTLETGTMQALNSQSQR